MERTKIFTALAGVRGRKPVDLPALETLLVRFSYLVVEQPWIKEIDINPLLASPERLTGARRARGSASRRTSRASRPKPAIRPYPAQYAQPWRLRGRGGSDDSSHPPGRRAPDGRASTPAIGAERLPAVFPSHGPRPARGRTTA